MVSDRPGHWIDHGPFLDDEVEPSDTHSETAILGVQNRHLELYAPRSVVHVRGDSASTRHFSKSSTFTAIRTRQVVPLSHDVGDGCRVVMVSP